MVETVFFDIGGTLMHEDPPIPDVFARVARRRGHDVTAGDVEPCMHLVDEYYKDEYLRDGDFWCDHNRSVKIWLDMYGMMARFAHVDDVGLPQAVYDEYLRPENWSFYPDAKTCLKDLKDRGFRLGVISNWDANLEGLLRDIGYRDYFDEVIVSAAVGCRKPSRDIFEIALQRMSAKPEHAVHVGDLPEADGQGASAAGVRPVIIDRNGRFPECGFERITALTDLVDIL